MELHIEETGLAEFVEGIRSRFEPLAQKKGLAFNIEYSTDAPRYVQTDPQRLQQIIKNLLSNALKFTDEGSITLRIEQTEADVRQKVESIEGGDVVAFSVSDTGPGVPEDKRDVIFEAFQQADGTTNRKYGGTGLGLSISRELARLLGGELQMRSVEGRGSNFILYLPESKEVGLEERELQYDRDDGISEGYHVEESPATEPSPLLAIENVRDDRRSIHKDDKSLLIVEDDARFAQVLVSQAHQQGFKCLVAGNGETGLHFTDYYKPSAIILDINLPGIDGWAVMERLKANPETRHIPVHFISSSERSIEALRQGAIGYLAKPVQITDIRDTLKRIEVFLEKEVRRVLIIEGDKKERKRIAGLVDGKGVDVIYHESFGDPESIRELEIDCIVADPAGREEEAQVFLEKLAEQEVLSTVPVVLYSADERAREAIERLQETSKRIVIKGAKSDTRLLDETALFLHRITTDLPEKSRSMLSLSHDKEAVFAGKKVLLVDDDMRNVFALTSVLEQKGVEVTAAKDGRDALDKLKTMPDTDLVLMDIMMPGMDGYEAMDRIRNDQKLAKLPIIALTAKAMKGDREKCIQAGANDYLSKPVDVDKLLSLLRVWLYR
jgi:tubulin-specific chaperone A